MVNRSQQRHLEEETIEVTFKSKSIQLKTKKNSSTGLTDAPIIGASDAWRKFRRPVGLSLLEASWNQVKSLYITGWTDGPKQSTGALDVLCSREHVLVDLNSSSAPVEPTLQNQPPVHWMYYVPESLFELIDEPLQHRLNRCILGACTGAMTQTWILCQKPQRLLIGHRETGWTDASNLSPVGSSGGLDFSAVDFQRLCNSFHSI